MTHPSRLFAAFLFAAIALFLVSYTWLPSRQGLQREDGQVTHITPQANTWYEVEITTASGARITCRTRRGWPIAGPDRCPLDQFERVLGQTVQVSHDGKHPYEVSVGSQTLVAYSAHRKVQMLALALAGFMLVLAAWVWRRK
jgi:hypothetical protein